MRTDWRERLAGNTQIRAASERLAETVAQDARGRTPVGDTGEARDSIQVVTDDDGVWVVGGVDPGWHFIFIEVGGRGWRPPPMPIRRAAEQHRQR